MTYWDKLRAMSPTELIAERDRQNERHDRAVDRCEKINSPTIKDAAAKSKAATTELRVRGYNPWADEPERL